MTTGGPSPSTSATMPPTRDGGHAGAPRTRFSSTPMPSISMRTTSPAFRYRGGLKPMPTPAGVPVAMMSPGAA